MVASASGPNDFYPQLSYGAVMNSNQEPQHTGEAPSRRPPEDEPERIGEGELGSDDGPPVGAENMRDEDYATSGRPMPEGTEPAEALQRNRKPGEGQLTTGSGGDAARTGKEGIFGKPIPPRESME